MQQFIEKFRDQVTGVLSGFDRLVFRGSLRRLNQGWWDHQLKATVASGMEQYLWQNQILFKDYLQHMKRASERLKKESLKPFEEQGLPVVFLRDPSAEKDALARKVAKEKAIGSGLVCAISTVEPSPTFEHRGTHILRRTRPCGVLYQYQIHPDSGMDVRAHPDVVSLQHPSRAEWAGMAGPADGQAGVAIPATGQLLCCGWRTGSGPRGCWSSNGRPTGPHC